MNRASVGLLSLLLMGVGTACRDKDQNLNTPTPSEGGNDHTPTEPPTPTATPVVEDPATLNIVVVADDGRPLEGAEVRVANLTPLVTDATGRARIEGVPHADGALVQVAIDGYSLGQKRVYLAPDTEATLRMVVEQGGVDTQFMGTQGYEYDDFKSGLRIHIPPNSLINAQGQPWSGIIHIRHTLHDLSGEGLHAAPGQFLEEDLNGNLKALSAYAALSLEVTDDRGNALDLNGTARATIELPLAKNANLAAGAVVPLWTFRPEKGGYASANSESVGVATLLTERHSVQTQMRTLAPILAARPTVATQMGGVVRDRNGASLEGAQLTVAGGYPARLLMTFANEDGGYCLNVPGEEVVEVEAQLDVDGVIHSKSADRVGTTCGGTDVELNLDAGCISGNVVGADGLPDASAPVWTDAATLAQTSEDGSFCVMGPVDRAVTVRTPGFSDRSVPASAEESCPLDEAAPTCAAHLDFIAPQLGYTYHLTELALAPPSQGLDLNDDGEVDNGLAEAVQIAYSGILDYVEAFLDDKVERGIISQERADEIYAKVVVALEDFDEAVGLNPIAALVSRGALMWVMDARLEGETAALSIYSGLYDGFGFSRGDEIAQMSGTTAFNWIDVGPVDLEAVLPPENSAFPTEDTATIQVLGLRSEAYVDAGKLEPGMMGALLPNDDILNAADTFIPEEIAVEAADWSVEIPKEDIMAILDNALTTSADFTLEDGSLAISMGVEFAGEPFGEKQCIDGYWMNQMQVAEAGVGFDLDGDGDIDNGTESLFSTIEVAGELALGYALEEANVPDVVADGLVELFGDTIAEVLSIESVNQNLQQNLDDFNNVPMLTLAGSDPARLTLYDGEFTGEGYGAGYLTWSLDGVVEAGRVKVTDAMMVREFATESPLNGDVVVGSIDLYLPRVEANIYEDRLGEGLISYAIPVDEIMVLVEILLETLRQYPLLGEDFGVEFTDSFAVALNQGADLYLGETVGYAYSMVYAFDAPEACLTKLPASTDPQLTPLASPAPTSYKGGQMNWPHAK